MSTEIQQKVTRKYNEDPSLI